MGDVKCTFCGGCLEALYSQKALMYQNYTQRDQAQYVGLKILNFVCNIGCVFDAVTELLKKSPGAHLLEVPHVLASDT